VIEFKRDVYTKALNELVRYLPEPKIKCVCSPHAHDLVRV